MARPQLDELQIYTKRLSSLTRAVQAEKARRTEWDTNFKASLKALGIVVPEQTIRAALAKRTPHYVKGLTAARKASRRKWAGMTPEERRKEVARRMRGGKA